MKFLLVLLAICIGGWVVISPFLWIHWLFSPTARASRRERFMYAILVGTLIGLTGLCGAVFEALLGFLPDTWGGYDANGDFVTMRHSLSATLGFIACVIILWMLGKRASISAADNARRAEFVKRP